MHQKSHIISWCRSAVTSVVVVKISPTLKWKRKPIFMFVARSMLPTIYNFSIPTRTTFEAD